MSLGELPTSAYLGAQLPSHPLPMPAREGQSGRQVTLMLSQSWFL